MTIIVSIEVGNESLKDTYDNGNLKMEISYIRLSLGKLDSVLLETNEELTRINLSVSVVGI